MTNEQLVIRIKAGDNVAENMLQLYNQVKLFIHSIAWKYRDSGDLEDLEQEGYLALYPAIDGYDPDTGCKFLTYAEYHIRQRMQRYIWYNHSCLRLPVHCTERILQYKKFVQSFQLEHGREPTARECSRFMGLTLEQIENIRKNACMANVGSLDAPVMGKDGGEDTTVGDLTADPVSMEDDILDQLQQEHLSAVLWSCVDGLEPEQAAVIRKRYQGGMTFDAISKSQGATRERIRQIEAKALRKLRNPIRSKQLRPFLPDEVYSVALYGSVESFNRTFTSATERAAFRMAGD
jgi:RNA polymerase primary sigma factor